MTRYVPPQHEAKKKRPLLPIIGLVLAICFGVIAYVIAPSLVDLIADQSVDLERQFAEFRRDYGENSLDYVMAALIWLLMFGLTVFLVSLVIGEDPSKEAFDHMGPHPTDKKAIAKARRQAQKEARKRLKKREAERKKEKRPF